MNERPFYDQEVIFAPARRRAKDKCANCGERCDGRTICPACLCQHGRLKMLCEDCYAEKGGGIRHVAPAPIDMAATIAMQDAMGF